MNLRTLWNESYLVVREEESLMRQHKVSLIRTDEEIRQILEASAYGAARTVIAPIEEALAHLKEEAVTRYLIPTLPHIIMSVRTMQTFFESLYEQLGKENFQKVINEIGENAGLAFGDNFIGFLRHENALPKDAEVLFKMWAHYDSSANWGIFSFEILEQQAIVTVEKSFLVKDRVKDPHRFCHFLQGYIFGFMWLTLKEQYRWFTEEFTRPAVLPLEPRKIVEKPDKRACRFMIKLAEEALAKAFDQYIEAKEAFRAKDYDKSAWKLRSALEVAFKTKIDLDVKSKISFYALVKAYKRANVTHLKINFREVEEIYHKTSAVVHASTRIKCRDLPSLLFTVGGILRVLELGEIGKRKKEATRKELAS